MKKIILILAGLLIGSTVWAQPELSNSSVDSVGKILIFYKNIDVTDSIVILPGDPNIPEIVFPEPPFEAVVLNNTVLGLWITLEKVNLTEVPGTQNYFCWGVFCCDSSVHFSEPYLVGPFWGSNSFSAHYEPHGNIGITKVRYYFRPDQNVQPSFVEVWFDTWTGVEEFSNKQIIIYPNPSPDGMFYLDGLNTTGIVFDVYDILGNKIANIKNNKIDLGSQPAGIYFLKSKDFSRKIFKL